MVPTWSQLTGVGWVSQPVTFVGGITNQPVVNVTNFPQPGIYAFQYTFSDTTNCQILDTMTVEVIECETCACFNLMDCCTYWDLFTTNSRKYDNPEIISRIEEFRTVMREKYKTEYKYDISRSENDDCDLCDYPDEEFPVFLVDTCTSPVTLISTGDYNISWSNNPGVNANPNYMSANQQVNVFATNADSSCTFADSLLVVCCDDASLNATITPICNSCDPCANPNVPLLIHAVGNNGPLTSTGYTFSWGGAVIGATNGSSVQVYVNDTVWVEITDILTGCVYTDTFTYQCCNDIDAPTNLACERLDTETLLSWSPVPQAGSYQVIITLNDPECCDTGIPTVLPAINTTNPFISVPSQYECFSWYVIAECATGDATAQSDLECSCPPPPCDPCKELEPIYDIVDIIDGCTYVFEGFNQGEACADQQFEYTIYDAQGNVLIVLTGANQTFNFPQNGSYKVCIKIYVEDEDGVIICEHEFCDEVIVDDCQGCDPCEAIEPIVDIVDIIDGCTYFFEAVNGGVACDDQQFVYTIYDAQGNILAVLAGANQTFTFPQNGSYKVCVRIFVEDADGNILCENEQCEEVIVEDCQGCIGCDGLEPIYDIVDIIEGCTYVFNGFNQGEPCPTQQYEYRIFDNSGVLIATLVGQNQTFTFPQNGVYRVCLTIFVEDANGDVICRNEYCEFVEVEDCQECDACDIRPAFDVNLGLQRCEYIFDGRNDGTDCPAQEYNWTVTNTATGLAVLYPNTPMASFIAPFGRNRYEVCLEIVVRNDDGSIRCSDRVCQVVTTRCRGIVIDDDISIGLANAVGKGNLLSVSHKPNPADEYIIVQVKGLPAVGSADLIILDNSGNKVSTSTITKPTSKVDVSKLKKGLYYYFIKTQLGVSERHKLLIE